MSLAFVVACATTGDDGTGDDQGGGTAQTVCGDGTCSATEVNNCAQDCGTGGNNNGSGSATGAVCGNGQCETTKGESVSTCPSDCNTGGGSGSGSNNQSGTCPSDPNACLPCILDATACPSGLDQQTCITCLFGP